MSARYFIEYYENYDTYPDLYEPLIPDWYDSEYLEDEEYVVYLSDYVPSSLNYEFVRWVDSSGYYYYPGEAIGRVGSFETVALYAEWTPKTSTYVCTVYFDAGSHGHIAEADKVLQISAFDYYSGNYVPSPTPDPDLGYEFDHWVGDGFSWWYINTADLRDSGKFEVTLTATYFAKPYLVNFYEPSGEHIDLFSCTFGDGTKFPEYKNLPAGYTFDGWSVNSEIMSPGDSIDLCYDDGDVEATAVLHINKLIIHYPNEGDHGDYTQEYGNYTSMYQIGAGLYTVEHCKLSLYGHFIDPDCAWFLSANNDITFTEQYRYTPEEIIDKVREEPTYSDVDLANSDIHVYLDPNWQPNVVCVTLDPDDGGENGLQEFYYKYDTVTVMGDVDVCYYADSECITPINSVELPTREGYLCTGFWSTEDDFQYVDSQGNIVNDLFSRSPFDVTLYAQWEELSYTITYFNEESTGESRVISVKYWEDLGLEPASVFEIQPEGLKLVGWKLQLANTRDGNGELLWLNKEWNPVTQDYDYEWLGDTEQRSLTAEGRNLEYVIAAPNELMTYYREWDDNICCYSVWRETLSLTIKYHSNDATYSSRVIIEAPDVIHKWIITEDTNFSDNEFNNLNNYTTEGDSCYMYKDNCIATGYWKVDDSDNLIHQSETFNSLEDLCSKLGIELQYEGNQDVHLYAQWSGQILTINYWSNGATDVDSSTDITDGENNILVYTETIEYVDDSTTYQLQDYTDINDCCYMTRAGYWNSAEYSGTDAFWQISSTGTYVSIREPITFEQLLTLTEHGNNINLYAIWHPMIVRVELVVDDDLHSEFYYHYKNYKEINDTKYYYFEDSDLSVPLSKLTYLPSKSGHEFSGFDTTNGIKIITSDGSFVNDLWNTVPPTFNGDNIQLFVVWDASSTIFVKTSSGSAKPGKVYVRLDSGKWIEGTGVYVKTDKGWKISKN